MASAIKSYAGVDTPAFFIVEKISFEVLPPSTIKSMDIPRKSGAYFINKNLGIRTFSVEFSIKADTAGNVMYYADDLAEWLNYDEPQPLIFRDKPDQTYYAIVSGNSDLTKFSSTGKGKIDFVCLDPHAYGIEKEYSFAPQNTDPIMVTNNGNTPAYPILQMQFTKNLADFSVMTDNDALIFGDFDATTQTAADLKPLYIDDTGASTSGWTNGVSVDGGVVTGTLTSNGYSFQQGSKDYGTGTNWHGGSLIKSLGKQVQDFVLGVRVGFQSSNINQLGRVEVYLLDINGNKIGKMAIRDGHTTGDYPNFEAWAGAVGNGGTQFRNTYGDYKGVFKNFDGIIRIGRVGQKWHCYIAKVDANGRHNTRAYKEYWDRPLKYQDKVAAIQIHIAQNSTYAPVNVMYVSNVRFSEILSAGTNQVDYVFRTNDILTIDCNTNEILKNGEPYYEALYPSSSFLKLEKGVNGISVSDPSIKNGTIKFNERWL
ncbi:distal tail protein Dit [Priestia megaterium]|uniref:distal tail protein Dit n=1 Tax=Priestia megaterium TaxID=1404 RepID=UPI003D270409